jgi:hypothetical protein
MHFFHNMLVKICTTKRVLYQVHLKEQMSILSHLKNIMLTHFPSLNITRLNSTSPILIFQLKIYSTHKSTDILSFPTRRDKRSQFMRAPILSILCIEQPLYIRGTLNIVK